MWDMLGSEILEVTTGLKKMSSLFGISGKIGINNARLRRLV
jgi:hypothetical protein